MDRVEAMYRAAPMHLPPPSHPVWDAILAAAGVDELEAEGLRGLYQRREVAHARTMRELGEVWAVRHQLEAENARLREMWDRSGKNDLIEQRDAARRELTEVQEANRRNVAAHMAAEKALRDLRAGVVVVLDTYRDDIPWQVEQDLRAVLTEAP